MYSVGVIMGSWGLIKSEESQAYFHLVESGVVAAAVVLTAGGASSRGEKKDETESTFGMKSTSRYRGKLLTLAIGSEHQWILRFALRTITNLQIRGHKDRRQFHYLQRDTK